MIPIFDLDDTLYIERTYVESGLMKVAEALEDRFKWPAKISFTYMLKILQNEGRGFIFNKLLHSKGVSSAALVKECINIYRHHKPNIQLAPMVYDVLCGLNKRPYLVTDGHKNVQMNKVIALNLTPIFQKIYITHRYGIHHAKPSTYCFNLIRKRENCEWHDMFYVGDNPNKDFVNLNSLGVHTIRIMTGEYSKIVAAPGFDATHKINSFNDLKKTIEIISK